MKLRCIVFTLGVFCSFLMSSSVEKFSITKKEDNRVSIAFSNEEIIISSKEGFDYITENKNSTIQDKRNILGRVSMNNLAVEGTDEKICIFDDFETIVTNLNSKIPL